MLFLLYSFFSIVFSAQAEDRNFPYVSIENISEKLGTDNSDCDYDLIGKFLGASCSDATRFYFIDGRTIDFDTIYTWTTDSSLDEEKNTEIIDESSLIGWGSNSLVVFSASTIEWWKFSSSKISFSSSVDFVEDSVSNIWVVSDNLAFIKTDKNEIATVYKGNSLEVSGPNYDIRGSGVTVIGIDIMSIFLMEPATENTNKFLIGLQVKKETVYKMEYDVEKDDYEILETLDLSWASCNSLTTYSLTDFLLFLCQQDSSTNATNMYFYSKNTFDLVSVYTPSPNLNATTTFNSTTSITTYSLRSEYMISFEDQRISLSPFFNRLSIIYLTEKASFVELLFFFYDYDSNELNQMISAYKFQLSSSSYINWIEFNPDDQTVYSLANDSFIAFSSCTPYYSSIDYTENFSSLTSSGCNPYLSGNIYLNNYENTVVNLDCYNTFSILCLADNDIRDFFNLLINNNVTTTFEDYVSDLETGYQGIVEEGNSLTSVALSLGIGLPILCILIIAIVTVIMVRRSRWYQLYKSERENYRKEREMRTILEGFGRGVKIHDLPEGEEENLNRIREEIKECIEKNELSFETEKKFHKSDDEELFSAVKSQYRQFDEDGKDKSFRFNFSRNNSPQKSRMALNLKLNLRCPICTRKITDKKFTLFNCGKHRAHTNCLWLYSSYKRKKREEEALNFCPFKCSVLTGIVSPSPPKYLDPNMNNAPMMSLEVKPLRIGHVEEEKREDNENLEDEEDKDKAI